nr:EAL domain-containing protein [Catenuloplanes nepalensis]
MSFRPPTAPSAAACRRWSRSRCRAPPRCSACRLSRFNVEALKIDKVFVDDLGTPRGRDMVTALVALARSCGMATVAEGVEDPFQRDALRDLGCDFLQGYLLSRPVPAADVLPLLAAKVF